MRRTRSTLRIDSWIQWHWIRKPLCLEPPSTRHWPALGVTLRISLTYSTRSSLETSLKFSPTPTGNPNSSLRQRKIQREFLRYQPNENRRHMCRVCSCCCKICSLSQPTKPFLATVERRSLRDDDAVNVERSESSTILLKSLESSFIRKISSFRSEITSNSSGKASSILSVKVTRVLFFFS